MTALSSTAFALPAWFDLGATACFALSGALAGMRRGYDVVGVVALALLTGVGGGLIRDGLFLQNGPPVVVSDGRYLAVVLAGAAGAALLGPWVHRIRRVIAVFDALGLGAYAVVGVQLALAAELPVPAAVLVGLVNASGGGLLRDLVTREEPLVFKPGQFYVLVALAGAVLFVLLTRRFGLDATLAALLTMLATFVLRALTIALNWKTSPLTPPPPAPESGSDGGGGSL